MARSKWSTPPSLKSRTSVPAGNAQAASGMLAGARAAFGRLFSKKRQ